MIELADADLGSVPAWLSGIGTVGTLSLTTRILLKAGRRERSEQARAVAAWEDPQSLLESGGHRPASEDSDTDAHAGFSRVWIHNGSSLPISLPTYLFRCVFPDGEKGGAIAAFLVPDAPEADVVTTLRPGEAASCNIVPRCRKSLSLVMFVDAAGQGWERDLLTGGLVNLTRRELEARREDTSAWLKSRLGWRERWHKRRRA